MPFFVDVFTPLFTEGLTTQLVIEGQNTVNQKASAGTAKGFTAVSFARFDPVTGLPNARIG